MLRRNCSFGDFRKNDLSNLKIRFLALPGSLNKGMLESGHECLKKLDDLFWAWVVAYRKSEI